MSADPQIVNIAAYKFADLSDLPVLRRDLFELCRQRQLKGTILLSTEGINLFIAGTRDGIDALLAHIRGVAGLENLEAKQSLSQEIPFNRLLIKIKREIIAFGIEGIDPRRYSSKRISARELRQWLDAGRPVTLLDTRNDFEVQAGTFHGAVAVGIDDFREFPQAAARLPEALKQQPIVTFCTGGIRCEKAAPYLESRGFSNVYQLEGGILKYLEECGGAHYRGQCFVFDKRVSLDANLSAGDLRQCFVCQAVLSPEEQASPLYVEGESCPHCHCSEEESLRRHLGRRQQALQRVCLPLPGSVPYDNVRPISVPQRLDGVELLDFLDAMRTQLSREDWRQVCRQGRLVCRGQQVLPGRVVRAGERLLHTMPATREPDVNGAIQILHEDDAIVVVNPPAPLPAHPCGRFNRNSLTYLLGLAYHPLRLRPAHRLDADTTGVMVFSKTGQIARIVQPQFDAGLVGKTYLARVHGRPAGDVFECQAALSAAPAADGVRLPDENGAAAHTRFEVLRALSDSTTLLKAYPLTGRTNQIRAHLWLLDLPIVGDPIYLPGRQLGSTRSLSLRDPPLCLHAAAVEFTHPLNGQRQQYAAAAPAWASNQG